MNWEKRQYDVFRESFLRTPSFLVGFRNEIGNVSGKVFEAIGNESKLIRLGALRLNDYFSFTSVKVEDSIIRFPECDFYSFQEGNILLFMGDPPNREPFQYCNAILDFATKQCHAEEVFTIGGFVSPISHTSPRKIFGTVTRPELRMFLAPYNVSIDVNYHTPAAGPRPSLNHFLLWTAKQREIPGYSLWVEVPFYLANLNDPSGAKAIMNFLKGKFALDYDYHELDQQVKEVNEILETLKNKNVDIHKYLQLLDQGIALSHDESETLAREVRRSFNKKN